MEAIDILHDALKLLGGLLSFLGATGIVLFALSLLLLALVGAFSPLPKMVNYVATVGLVTGVALFGFEGFGELPERLEAVRGYLVVMLGPVVLFFMLHGLLRPLVGRRDGSALQLQEAVTELTEQVAQLRRERRAEAPRETLTMVARATEPRRLRQLD